MSKKTISRKASDNRYYHPDFHLALNHSLDYLLQNLGEEAVREYLSQFAKRYFASLKRELAVSGLTAIRAHYEKIFEVEKAAFDTKASPGELHIRLSESPAVKYIRAAGYQVSAAYHETVATVNQEICRDTEFECELLEYNRDTGAYHLRFLKRQK
jgi:hypothetical protein